MNETLNKIVNWSSEQLAIFAWFATGLGNLIVRARAGTGKTTTIKEAFNHAPPSIQSMLYAVFNKKNQIEAQGKITDSRVTVKTLHALGFGFILKFWRGVKPDNYVERDRLLDVCPDCPSIVATQVCKLVSFLKNGFINPTLDDTNDTMNFRDIGIESGEYVHWNSRIPQLALDVLAQSKIRDSRNRISFDDMVWLPVAMDLVKPQFDLVVVDECQDMNMPQLTMAIQSCKSSGRVCLVGDDRQAIYGFRGAITDGIDLFKNRLNASELGLTLTYRCPKHIVTMAQRLVSDYRVADTAPDGKIENLNEEKALSSVVLGDAILSRINAPLMRLCLALLRRNVSARIEGRDIGRTLLNIVKDIRAKSVPDFLTRLDTWLAKQIKRASGRNAQSKIDVATDQCETLRAVAEIATSIGDIETRLNNLFQDSEYATAPAVVLSSVHKAKGLEWNNVYLLQETFKTRPNSSPEDLRQEENIYYVAITRAKQYLAMVHGLSQNKI
jgi:superfamily I DNA/RNA helicase